MKRKGFTLIELVIVVAIIGILALMIIPQFNNVTRDAKKKTYQSNAKTVISAIAMYQAAHGGEYPGSGEELNPYLSIKNGWAGLADNPKTAVYQITAGSAGTGEGFKFKSAFDDLEIYYPEN